MYAFGLALPAISVLIFQYLDFSSRNSIRFGPFEVYLFRSSLDLLIPKIALSVVFPLVMTYCYGKEYVARVDFQISVMIFLFALLYYFFLVANVNGDEGRAGNFGWGIQIAVLLLFFVSTRFYAHKVTEVACLVKWNNKKIVYPGIAMVFHLVFGMVWLVSNINFPVGLGGAIRY